MYCDEILNNLVINLQILKHHFGFFHNQNLKKIGLNNYILIDFTYHL